MASLDAWGNFYVIVGSSAGALIGLQFVVITLIADLPIRDGSAQASSAFATPTVLHFEAVLLVSAFMSIPWKGISSPSILWGALGLCGAVYQIVVLRRMRKQNAYIPVFEDWLFHFILPFASYAILAASAIAVDKHVGDSLLGVGSAALLLLFVGIHNAWDAITYHVFSRRARKPESVSQSD
jgi:predicted membrane-bound spermidine synthase